MGTTSPVEEAKPVDWMTSSTSFFRVPSGCNCQRFQSPAEWPVAEAEVDQWTFSKSVGHVVFSMLCRSVCQGASMVDSKVKASREWLLSASCSCTLPHKLGRSAGNACPPSRAMRDGHSANAKAVRGGMNQCVPSLMGNQSSGNGTVADVHARFSVDAQVVCGLANSMNASAPSETRFRTSFNPTPFASSAWFTAGQSVSKGASTPVGRVHSMALPSRVSSDAHGGAS